jgi:hypothetical protein
MKRKEKPKSGQMIEDIFNFGGSVKTPDGDEIVYDGVFVPPKKRKRAVKRKRRIKDQR